MCRLTIYLLTPPSWIMTPCWINFGNAAIFNLLLIIYINLTKSNNHFMLKINCYFWLPCQVNPCLYVVLYTATWMLFIEYEVYRTLIMSIYRPLLDAFMQEFNLNMLCEEYYIYNNNLSKSSYLQLRLDLISNQFWTSFIIK